MPREGDVRFVSAELVFSYTEPDLSVGISGGWYATAISFDGREEELVEVKARIDTHTAEVKQGYGFFIEAKFVERIAEDLYNSDQEGD